jgi:C-terminal processing protease CtpA/Prc
MKKTLLGLSMAMAMLTGCSEGGVNLGDDIEVVQQEDECSAVNANQELFDYMDSDYFWYNELPTDFDKEAYANMGEALLDIRSEKDRFSFLMTEEEYQSNYVVSKYFGFGFSHTYNDDLSGLVIRYVFDDGSASENGLRRGDTIVEIDDVSVSTIIQDIQAGTKGWSDVFGPNEEGHSVAIAFEKPSGERQTATLEKSEVTSNTVLAIETKDVTVGEESKKVGYLVFNSFRDISRGELNDAFDQFKIDEVDELILDLRYNGGGLVAVANQLSTQVAGTNVEDEVFVKYTYNDKRTGFNSTSLFDLGSGIEQLNLDSIVVLTTPNSCSSSELVINSLTPHIDVTVIGDKTCGKPIGMQPKEICDHRVFAINFQTQNSEGYGDYFDGLPADCVVEDQVVGDWGAETDPLFAEGLHFIQNGSCSTSAKSKVSSSKEPDFDKIIDSLTGRDLH